MVLLNIVIFAFNLWMGGGSPHPYMPSVAAGSKGFVVSPVDGCNDWLVNGKLDGGS